SLAAEVERSGANERRLTVEPKDAPVGDVLLPLVPRRLVLAPDMPVSGHIEIDIGGGGRGEVARGTMTASPDVRNQPGERAPRPVTDEINAAFSYEGATHVIELTRLAVLAGDTNVVVKGHIAPAGDGDFSFELSGGQSAVAGAGAGDQPIRIDR